MTAGGDAEGIGRLEIDAELCCGHGRCYASYPDLFSYDDEGVGQVLLPSVPSELSDRARQSVRDCPERAITFSAGAGPSSASIGTGSTWS